MKFSYMYKYVHDWLIRWNHTFTYKADTVDDDMSSESVEEVPKKTQKTKPTVLKKPAGKKTQKWDWDSSDSSDDSDNDSDTYNNNIHHEDIDDDDILRDKNDAAWFKDQEHLLSKVLIWFINGYWFGIVL